MRNIEYRWVILTTGFLILFLGGGRLHLFGLLLKPMSEDLAMSRSALSLVVATFTVTSAVAVLVVGRLLDRYSLRLIMAVAAVVSALGFILMGQVTEPWQLFAVYALLIALGGPGISLVAIGVMISQWFDRRHGIVMATTQSGGYLGQLVILGLLAAFLSTLGWRNAYTVMGVAYLVLVPTLVLALVRSRPITAGGERIRSTPTAETRARAQSGSLTELVKSAARTRELYLLIVVYAICGFQDTFVATHMVAFATDQGVSQAVAGNLLAFMGVMGLLGVLSAGILADTFGAVKATMLCFVLRIGIFGFITYFQSPVAIGAFALLFGYTFPITAPLIVVFVRKIFGTTHLGLLSAFLLVVHQIPGGVGALVGAAFFDRTGGYDGAFVVMLGMAVVALVATAMIRERPAVPIAATA